MPIEFENHPSAARGLAASLAILGVLWGTGAIFAVRMVDDGPPIGALCIASPAFCLLIAAAAVASRAASRGKS